jgi:CheY-like chemotaxis protein
MEKILVVEDEEPISELIELNLSMVGYEVMQALDGEEALKIMNERINKLKKIYDEDEHLRERLIYEEERKWDIDRDDFNGFDNYVLRKHPIEKWESEEYKKLKKDPELLSLYDFISKMNSKAKSAGYISNKISSTFLPFVRKGMAESFAWDFSLSAVTNFGTNLSINADDVVVGDRNVPVAKTYKDDLFKVVKLG